MSRRRRLRPAGLPLLLGMLAAVPAGAQPNELPPALAQVGFDQRLGESVPLDASFRDETGAAVRLGDLVAERPVVLVPVYYECPMLCTLVLNGLVTGLRVVGFDAGREFDVVAVSIDPGETPDLAAAKKRAYLGRYGRPGSEAGWHFLTGDETEIRRLTDAIGFHYSYDAATGQYAHAAGVLVLTPGGRIARAFFGVEFPPRDLRLALVEAADGKIGSLVDSALLYCFQYDPHTGRYSAAVMNLVRAGGALTVLLLAGTVIALRRREGHRLAPQRNAR